MQICLPRRVMVHTMTNELENAATVVNPTNQPSRRLPRKGTGKENYCWTSVPRCQRPGSNITPRGACPDQRNGSYRCRLLLWSDTAVPCRVQFQPSNRSRSLFAPAGTVTAVIGAAAFKTAPVEASGTAPECSCYPVRVSAPSSLPTTYSSETGSVRPSLVFDPRALEPIAFAPPNEISSAEVSHLTIQHHSGKLCSDVLSSFCRRSAVRCISAAADTGKLASARWRASD